MNRLDDMIRTGLAQAAEAISEPSTDELARRLTERRSRGLRRARVARAVLGAAAVFVALAAVTTLTRGDDATDRVDTVLPPADGQGFAAYAPGWHEFDAEPAPASASPSLAWTGRELLIADLVVGTTRSKVSAYAPASRTWRGLDKLPIDGDVTIAWAGGHLVAIGTSFPAADAAIWDSEDDRWEDLDHPPILQAMAKSISGGPRTINSNLQLIWTGQRLLDLTHGAALDPESRRWKTMAAPDDLTGYLTFAGSTTPVWDGREVVLAGWTSASGLAWTATGSTYREIPGLPADVAETEALDGADVVEDSIATLVHGRVLLVSGTDSGSVASFDGRSDTWRREPSMTGMLSEEGCPSLAATVAGRAVAMPCSGDTPVVLDDAGWKSIGPHPFPAPCCGGVWIDADDALVAVWSTGGSNGETREEPGIRAAVWVPPGS